MLPPWEIIYGGWAEDGGELGIIIPAFTAWVVGYALWCVTWFLVKGERWRPWVAVAAASLLVPYLIVNVYSFNQSRQDVCRIRTANGHDERLHDLFWPLALNCPYGPDLNTDPGPAVTGPDPTDSVSPEVSGSGPYPTGTYTTLPPTPGVTDPPTTTQPNPGTQSP
jgi:hypothetical protein